MYKKINVYRCFKYSQNVDLFIFSCFVLQALSAPEVTFKADKDSLWTLILTNPDGHLSEENSEYVHWFM